MPLPFSPQQGSTLPDQAATPTLGGAAPDAMSLLRQQLAGIDQPRQWGRGEGIGNILQSIGAGFMGQQPAYIQQDQELAQRKQKSLQIEMMLQQMQQQTQAQQSKARLDSLKEATNHLKEWNTLKPEEQKTQKPWATATLKLSARNAGIQLEDQDIDNLLSSPNISQAYADLFDPTVAPTQAEQQARLTRLGSVDAKDREGVAVSILKEDDEKALTLIRSYLPQVVQMYGGTKESPLDVTTFTERLKADPEISKALSGSSVLQRNLTSYLTDPKNAEELAGFNLKPGKTALKEQELSAAEKLSPKFAHLTPYAETLLPFMVKETKLAHPQLNQMAVTDPNRFAAVVEAAQLAYDANLDRRAREQGAEAARIRLETPEKLSQKERMEEIESENTISRLQALESLYRPEFVGPVAGRAGGVREAYTGDITPQEAEFRARTTSFNNQMIKDITGAQMSEPEAKRIKAELPDVNMPPVTYEARLRMSRENAVLLQYKRRMVLQKTGADVSKLPPLPQLPARFRGHPDLFSTSGTESIPTKNPPVMRSGAPTRTR